MASVNKVILIGNVGRDPEIRYMQSGEPIANFTLATNEVWNDKSGQRQERTEWHRVEVFGKTAQVVRDYVTKGKPVYIEGSIIKMFKLFQQVVRKEMQDGTFRPRNRALAKAAFGRPVDSKSL